MQGLELRRRRLETSSEILGAAHEALGLRLVDLTGALPQQLARRSLPARPIGPVNLAG